jgi:hypothetical protein
VCSGSEGGLMSLAGWSRRDMIDRYTAHTAADRAAEEARRLGLGEGCERRTRPARDPRAGGRSGPGFGDNLLSAVTS